MMMVIGGGGLTSITLFVRAAAVSIFIHGIVTFHLLIFSGTLMMALKAKMLNGKAGVRVYLWNCHWVGVQLASWGVEDLIVGWLGWWLASWPGWWLW